MLNNTAELSAPSSPTSLTLLVPVLGSEWLRSCTATKSLEQWYPDFCLRMGLHSCHGTHVLQ